MLVRRTHKPGYDDIFDYMPAVQTNNDAIAKCQQKAGNMRDELKRGEAV